MNISQKTDFLHSMSFFQDLTHGEVTTIAQYVEEKLFEEKDILIQQDDFAETIYCIYDGLVRVYRITESGTEAHIALLGKGELIGEMAFIEKKPRSAYVQAIKKTLTFLLTKKAMNEIFKKHTCLAVCFMKQLSGRIRLTDYLLEEMHSKNLTERTWDILYVLSRYFPTKKIPFSHEELATIIGATRPRVSEVLTSLRNKGKIRVGKRLIEII